MNSGQVLVVGLGCQRGCPASVLRILLDETLQAHGIALEAVGALASIDLKRDEPGLLELAGQLGLPLTFFSAAQLAGYRERLSHPSQVAFERTGCYGVAESAALALAERLGKTTATLRIPRQKCAQATLALAVAS
ncbi:MULTISPECIES: cobalamin biosynthesis protein [unclassified Pseudomonas]|uniref:cobalamin biosynthesis protein n=1 Tax=unclassified Pseudomonas TaxID=196821 RepID=UPI001199F03B|nr:MULTISPECIES: cobalamin biosynthesis protein [unclassified Pseudomonas]TWC18517.1 cobalt-precorrin 5A hydrolase [Pseudomonas sp. SJZ075]TWC23522.1 cobalt-precorrin 5A hydrolase [Pseudomonas sp. SJZ074]TWC34712.1 cobalt-precorrin 5A hydrolase [Pseudomonas sp. SJZ078]TWC40531.1 cobalt-precorrin 5A hydrolase [Pseudomonas sp. SJZ085]TWC55542.1 cobalt-precorrin 5A hydrolase [Pseudomonas sp. SJZ124]